MGWRPGLSFERLMGSSYLLHLAEETMNEEYAARAEAQEQGERARLFAANAAQFRAEHS